MMNACSVRMTSCGPKRDDFITQIFGFSMGNLDRFSPSLYFPLISPLETENIPSIWLDQDVNFCFCIYYNLFLPI